MGHGLRSERLTIADNLEVLHHVARVAEESGNGFPRVEHAPAPDRDDEITAGPAGDVGAPLHVLDGRLVTDAERNDGDAGGFQTVDQGLLTEWLLAW